MSKVDLRLFVGIALSAFALQGCSAECSSALDCPSLDVCYKEVCTPATASWVVCGGDEDCNGEGVTNGPFTCRAARCRLNASGGSTNPGNPDAGPGADASTDAGPNIIPDAGSDAGVPADSGAADAGSPDATPTPDAGAVSGALTVDVEGSPDDFSNAALARFDGQMTNASNVVGQNANGDTLIVRFPGAIPGPAACDNGASVNLIRNGGGAYVADNILGSCTIDVGAFGDVGQPVQGTFSGTVEAASGAQLVLTNGQFDLVRTQ